MYKLLYRCRACRQVFDEGTAEHASQVLGFEEYVARHECEDYRVGLADFIGLTEDKTYRGQNG